MQTSLLDGYQFYRLLSTPRPGPKTATADDDRGADRRPGRAAQLFAALAAAHAELGELGETDGASDPAGAAAGLVVSWHRPAGERELQIVVGGRPDFPPADHTTNHADLAESSTVADHADAAGVSRTAPSDADMVAVMYPPGSRARRLDTARLADQWHGLAAWVRCAGMPDPLWTVGSDDTDHRRGSGSRVRGGFDDYVAHLSGGFAWVVLATPFPADAVERELLDLEATLPRLRQRQSSEADRIAVVRAEGRYRELSRAMASGLWNVHVLVGAQTATAARRAAGLLCSASDLDELPYVLTPGTKSGHFEAAWSATVTDARDRPASPFTATGEFLAAVARPPRRELPGIRLVEPAEFDVTPEHSGQIHLGTVLDEADQPVAEFALDPDALNRHTFVAGATGSGKSQTVRHLLEGLHAAGVPWLVVEPAKAEYAGMAGRLAALGSQVRPDASGAGVPDDAVQVIRPGDPDAIPVGLNPLEPEPGFPLQTHLDLVRALFLAAFDADEPFPQVLSHALTRCYTDLGWDPITGTTRPGTHAGRYPNLSDLQRVALQVVEGVGYCREITDNVRGFIDVRLSSLRLGTPGRFFEGGHRLDVGKLLDRNTVLELEDIGSDQDKAFFIGAVLIRLAEHLRLAHRDRAPGLGHVTVIEEAHRLLRHVPAHTPAGHAVELFTALLAEIRAYGEGIVIAEQIPSKIVPDVIKNTAVKIMHRLPASDDRETVGATMNLDPAQSRHVVTLPPGRAAVFTDGMDHPIRVAVPLGEATEDARLVSRTPAVAGHRSAACAVRCHERPCLLRELTAAEHLATDPRLTVWVELAVIAHLTGQTTPMPATEWLGELERSHDRRQLECAIGHRVRAAVDDRYTGLAAFYPPESLAAHVAPVLHGVFEDDPESCDGSEFRWYAGCYRWMDVLLSLRAGGFPPDQPHPDTDRWIERGLILSAPTANGQLDQLRAHSDMWKHPATVIVGSGTPTALDEAIAALSQETERAPRLAAATAHLTLPIPWPQFVEEILPDEPLNGVER